MRTTTLIEAIRAFFIGRDEVHVQDLYAHLPEEKRHSIRARIYENLGRDFRRIGHGLYAAADGPAVCVVATGDAWEELPRIPSKIVDAIVTDPPYPWLDDWVGKGTTRQRMDWKFEKRDIDHQLGREMYRVLRDGAHAFIFVPAETATTKPHIDNLVTLLAECGLRFNRRWIWDKQRLGLGYSGRASHEGILFLSKGKPRRPLDLSIPDVLSVPSIHHRHRKHPAEKPSALLELLIRFATRAGELVLDCFAGSCSTGRTALAIGRNSLMIEKDETMLQVER